MPSFTYIHGFETARTTAGGRAEYATRKICETIGLFNAEYLAMSDIHINTHTISATGVNHIVKMRGHPRKYTAFLAIMQGRPHCFFTYIHINININP